MRLQGLRRAFRDKKSLLMLSLITATIVSLIYLIQDARLYQNPTPIKGNKTSIPTKIFYAESEDRFLKYKRGLSEKQTVYIKNWKKPNKVTNLSIQIERMGPLDENNNSIFISGKISAAWHEDSISGVLGPIAELDESLNYADDFLEKAQLITINESDQAFKKEILLKSPPCKTKGDEEDPDSDCNNKFKLSGYKFSGDFPLKRRLNKFPFDTFEWVIQLNLPGFPIEYNLEGGPIIFKLPEKPIGPYLAKSIDCPIHDDEYSGEKANACWNNSVRYIGDYKSKDGTIGSDNISNWTTTAVIYGEMERAVGTGFFRYLFPVIIVTLVLIVTDLLSIVQDKDLKDVKLVAPPTVILALVFMQSEYHASLPQISYLTYLDKLYYLVYAYSILSLVTSILEYKASTIHPKKSRRNRLISIKNIRIAMGIALLLLPFTLIW